MNTILVPTDFSPAAENATAYAAQLARQIEASLVLLHVYQLPVPMTDYPVLMVTNEDLKKCRMKACRGPWKKFRQPIRICRLHTKAALAMWLPKSRKPVKIMMHLPLLLVQKR
jgi:nucleotide-binding universal stress UspA family protein